MITPAILCLLLSLGAFLILITALRNDKRVRSWPTVSGTVVSSSIVDTTLGRAAGARNRSTRTPARILQVQYEYEVGSNRYTGTRFSNQNPPTEFVRSSPDGPGAELQEALRRYSPGTAVEVHYSAARPEHAYLVYKGTGGWRC